MARKASLLLAALALVAFAAPQFASANAKATDPAGTLLSAVSEPQLILTNVGNVTLQTSLGLLACSTVDITGKLTANTGTTYKGVSSGTPTTSGCSVGVNKPLTVTDLTITELHSATTLKGTINLKFVSDLPNGVVCTYTSPNLPYTVTGTDTIKIENGDLLGSPVACEPGTLNATFTVETDFAPFTQIHLD